jgi:hypothetical protein
MADRFFIAPYDSESGLRTNVKPWLIPDTAWSKLNNAYVWRGRVRKRFGSRWTTNTGNQFNSRLRVPLGTTDAMTGNLSGTVPGIEFNVGQMFSISTALYTVVSNTPGAQPMLKTVATTTATFDVSTGNYVFAGAPVGSIVYWYPALPVMGILTFETNNKGITEFQEPTIAFDTQFAYQFSTVSGGWDRIGLSVWNPTSTTANANFFWGATWTSTDISIPLFFVTNFDNTDLHNMRYWDGTTWFTFAPQIDSTPNYLTNARILVVFRNRLIALNTWEGSAYNTAENYVNRCRYSAVVSDTYPSPISTSAWRQDIPGSGSAIDAPTTEEIITAEFVKDRLIVFFERSTYELAYTGNQAYPFVWNKLNNELGAESTNSVVPFDNVCLGVANTGIHQCNGSQVSRIDNSIPSQVFEVQESNNGVERVSGIRDYFVEMVYWTFPDQSASSDFPYPSKVLIYNYQTGTWAINDDSFTVFGYWFQPQGVAVTWDSLTVTWDSDVSWDGGSVQSQYRQVLAGNQEGYIVIVDADQPTNAPALQITNITYSGLTVTFNVIDHNLRDGYYVLIQNIIDNGNIGTILNNTIYYAEVIDANNFSITVPQNPITPIVFTGTYQGGGTLALVSKIDAYTKEFNFYEKEGRNVYVSKVDFMVDSEALGQIQVNYYVSTATDPLTQDSLPSGSNAIMGTGILELFPYPSLPLEANASRLIHPVYFQADGEFVQLQLIYNADQMTTVVYNPDGSFSGPALEDFQLHFMVIQAQKSSNRFQ